MIGLAPNVHAQTQVFNTLADGLHQPLDDRTLHATPVCDLVDNGLAMLTQHFLGRSNAFASFGGDVEDVRQVGIESRTGFEIGLELTAKAARLGLPVAEIPTIWLDRRLGQSRFDLGRFLPGYLKWYFAAFGRRPNPVDPSPVEGAEVPADAYVPAP